LKLDRIPRYVGEEVLDAARKVVRKNKVSGRASWIFAPTEVLALSQSERRQLAEYKPGHRSGRCSGTKVNGHPCTLPALRGLRRCGWHTW
jgi:hypothetical protein